MPLPAGTVQQHVISHCGRVSNINLQGAASRPTGRTLSKFNTHGLLAQARRCGTSLRSTSRAVGRSAGLGAISHLTSLATCNESTEWAERSAGGQQARRDQPLDKPANHRGAQQFCVILVWVMGEELL